MDEGYVTVTEAAERLGVTGKTIRRWIRGNKLPAELREGAYGEQYYIPAQALETARGVIDIVKVERRNDPEALGLAVARAVHASLEGTNQALLGELRELKESMDRLSGRVDSLIQDRVQPPVEPLMRSLLPPALPKEGRGASQSPVEAGSVSRGRHWWQRMFDGP